MKKYRFFAMLLAVLLAASLTVPAMALDDPQPNCNASILVDGDNDEVLYEHNGYERIYPASITKIMTSLVVLEAIDNGELSLDQPITASQQATTLPEGSSNANPPIQAGEILTVEQLLAVIGRVVYRVRNAAGAGSTAYQQHQSEKYGE